MTFRVLLAIVLLSTTTSVIYGAPVPSGGDHAVEKGVMSGAPVPSGGDKAVDKGVISGKPVPSGGDQAVERWLFEHLQDGYWAIQSIQEQLEQLLQQIEDADDDVDPSQMGQWIADFAQLQDQAQPFIDLVYGHQHPSR
ncbi:hypothetical protein Bbelb_226460 [Branchiostoma belcheri]|nr:hypothetical protein Bbelb_226460 [Branchiostoma belcheri]